MPEPVNPPSPALRHGHPRLSAFRRGPGLTSSTPLVLRPSQRRNATTGHPGSPTCTRPTLGLLSLHNQGSQFLFPIINRERGRLVLLLFHIISGSIESQRRSFTLAFANQANKICSHKILLYFLHFRLRNNYAKFSVFPLFRFIDWYVQNIPK